MIKLSNDMFTALLKTVWLFLVILMVYFLYNKDYFLVIIFSFPVIGWALASNLFKTKSVLFNREEILIGSKKFDLTQIEEIESHILSNSFLKINGRKFFFVAPFSDHGLDNKIKKLKEFAEARKNEKLESTVHNNSNRCTSL